MSVSPPRRIADTGEVSRKGYRMSKFFVGLTEEANRTVFKADPEAAMQRAGLTEFEKGDYELKLRTAAIEYSEKPIELPQGQGGGAAPAAGGTGLPPGITNTKGWTDEQIAQKLEEVKKTLDWDNTTGSARKWWEAFESENKTRTALVLRLAEELQTRKATITEFFLAYVYSNTDNIQANLSYLDYTRLKKEEEKKKKEAAGKAIAGGGGDESGGQNW